MTEKEKRDAGLPYNAGSDPELLADVKRAKELCHRYNQLSAMDFDAQREILGQLLGKTGERFCCQFLTACHPVDAAERARWLVYHKPITVGDNVWFGAGVIVMPGVTIGNRSVIGAGSIVTKDIPSDVVAAGNPCRVLRPITEDDQIL